MRNLYEIAVRFIENLTLVGDYGGEAVKLRPFQKQILKALLKTEEGRRVVSKCLILLPRKNGKTLFVATLCLFFLICGGKNQQILSAASCEKQARLVFDTMREIIEFDPELSELLEIIPSSGRIIFKQTNSFFVAVSSGGAALHGLSPTIVVMDEIHAWDKKRHIDLYAALTTGFGARKNPLTIMISTQAAQKGTICANEFEYGKNLKNRIVNGKQIKSGSIENPSYLAVLYYCDPDKHDWTDPTVHRLVNPALGDFMSEKDFAEQFKLALEIPSQQQYFKQFRLNMLDVSENKWINSADLDACKQTEFDLSEYKCIGAGLDIAPVADLSAFVLLFEVGEKIALLPFAWCNESDIVDRSKIEGVPYRYWQEQGFIKLTKGNTTDFDIIRDDVIELCEKYNVPIVGADLQKGWEVAQGVQKHGIEVLSVKPYFTHISPPMKKLEKLIKERNLIHFGNPVLEYCIGNVIAEVDGQGLIRPSNKLRRRQDKIDVAVAAILGLAVSAKEQEQSESAYENRGVLII